MKTKPYFQSLKATIFRQNGRERFKAHVTEISQYGIFVVNTSPKRLRAQLANIMGILPLAQYLNLQQLAAKKWIPLNLGTCFTRNSRTTTTKSLVDSTAISGTLEKY